METVKLLQEIGLNQYEAEAYFSLLAHGPLTGYELGKRSAVPLSRSYEILERLSTRGLALRQPGDPPRYVAEQFQRFLAGVRARTTATLDMLAETLAATAAPDVSSEFWVARGETQVLDRLRSRIAAATWRLDLVMPRAYASVLSPLLARAPAEGRRVFVAETGTMPTLVLALADNRLALAGTLDGTGHCQALVGEQPALQALLRAYFSRPVVPAATAVVSPAAAPDWVDWETRKQRHLWQASAARCA
jgi:sugar-specific transcriptional regulator TrmB